MNVMDLNGRDTIFLSQVMYITRDHVDPTAPHIKVMPAREFKIQKNKLVSTRYMLARSVVLRGQDIKTHLSGYRCFWVTPEQVPAKVEELKELVKERLHTHMQQQKAVYERAQHAYQEALKGVKVEYPA